MLEMARMEEVESARREQEKLSGVNKGRKNRIGKSSECFEKTNLCSPLKWR